MVLSSYAEYAGGPSRAKTPCGSHVKPPPPWCWITLPPIDAPWTITPSAFLEMRLPSSVGKLSVVPVHVLCFGLVFFAPAEPALTASSATARTRPTQKRENTRPCRCLIFRTPFLKSRLVAAGLHTPSAIS